MPLPDSNQPATIRHVPERYRFEAEIDGKTALLQYRLAGDTITFVHTEVPPELEGRGIGGELAHAGLEFAKAERLRAVVRCSFVASYIHRHPEYEALLAG